MSSGDYSYNSHDSIFEDLDSIHNFQSFQSLYSEKMYEKMK